jgi:hypothetical protein
VGLMRSALLLLLMTPRPTGSGRASWGKGDPVAGLLAQGALVPALGSIQSPASRHLSDMMPAIAGLELSRAGTQEADHVSCLVHTSEAVLQCSLAMSFQGTRDGLLQALNESISIG